MCLVLHIHLHAIKISTILIIMLHSSAVDNTRAIVRVSPNEIPKEVLILVFLHVLLSNFATTHRDFFLCTGH